MDAFAGSAASESRAGPAHEAAGGRPAVAAWKFLRVHGIVLRARAARPAHTCRRRRQEPLSGQIDRAVPGKRPPGQFPTVPGSKLLRGRER